MKQLKKSPDQPPVHIEKLALQFVIYCLKKQNILALYLSRKFEELTPRQKKITLGLYISLITSVPITLIFRALNQ